MNRHGSDEKDLWRRVAVLREEVRRVVPEGAAKNGKAARNGAAAKDVENLVRTLFLSPLSVL
ncbi:MAG: hypothetical protein ACYTHM_16900 [Planctomycetota bacterium]|jgi:hypothetical protein